MNKLIILAIALVITSGVNGNDLDEEMRVREEIRVLKEAIEHLDNIKDRVEYYYICTLDKFPCKGLKRGDLLKNMTNELAALYCDADRPIISPVGFRDEHWCIYNGLEIREIKYRDADFSGIDRILDGKQ